MFDPLLIITMCMVMIVVMIESSGMFMALGDMTGKTVDRKALSAGLRTDGLGTLLGGIFNTFPYTSFSQNVGLVGVTGVKSRFVCVAGGVILIILGLIPKLSALVEALPTAVLGGAGLVMFGMVAATGIRILANVDFKTNRNNLFIVAIALGLGMIPLIAPKLQAVAAPRHPSADRVWNPAGFCFRGGSQRVFQWHQDRSRCGCRTEGSCISFRRSLVAALTSAAHWHSAFLPQYLTWRLAACRPCTTG